MKYAVTFLLLLLSCNAIAQIPKPKSAPAKKPVAAKAKPTPAPSPTPVPLSEKEQFEKASAYELAADRVAALDKFLNDFPQSEDRAAAVDLLATSRILIAEEKLLSGDAGGAISEYKKVIGTLPQPVPNDLYSESISKIPATLFARGQRAAAFEVASMIENKIEGDASQLLELVNFYLRIENGGEAMRVAAKAAAKDPNSSAVHRTIALVHRINFDLDLSADSYSRSLELDPESVAAKRGLAEMKRALGKPNEAAVLYRELVTKNESDLQARNGLVLSLFESGKRSEAEAELARTLESSSKNVTLLAGAAYWYASQGIGDKAVELAQKAVDIEPRYIWAHIALGRGLIAQGKPVAAERVLMKARGFGNFPTLEYELASARVAAGFFHEAVDDLAKQFAVTSSGVTTKLGGRIPREEKSLADLVAFERRASIFAYTGADSAETSDILKALLAMNEKLQSDDPNETEVASAATDFTKGSDKMKLHRQLYAASELLRKKVAIDKAAELVRSATGNTDTALDVADPGAAVMASELYDARMDAFRKNDFLLVPDVPRATLSSILRGRIEELAGWALYQQNNLPDAAVRLRRAISVLPAKSAWWRSSMWRLGAILAADGKDAEALNSYIESYRTDKPDFAKYVVLEALYKKVNNGSLDGLEEKIGRDRMIGVPMIESVAASPVQVATPESAASDTMNAAPASTPEPSPTVEAKPVEPKAEAIPVETKNEPPAPAVEDKPKSDPTEPAVKPESIPSQVEAKPEATPTSAEQKPETVPAEAKPEATPVSTEQKPETVPVEAKPETATPVSTEQEPEPTPAITEPTPSEPKGETPPTTETKPKEAVAVPAETPTPTEPAATPTETKTVDVNPPETKPEESSPTQTKSEEKPAEPSPKAEAKPEQVTEKPATTPSTQNTPAGKLLFEPIIITIPNSRRPKTTEPASATGEKPNTEKPKVEEEKANTASAKSSEEKSEPTEPATGSARPRVIIGQDVKGDEPTCTVDVSQENVSVINNGGTVGILVSVQGRSEIKDLVAVSSSPKDVEVILEPEIVGLPDRRFFVIKSVSTATGVYQISFSMPCGKKDVIVTVR